MILDLDALEAVARRAVPEVPSPYAVEDFITTFSPPTVLALIGRIKVLEAEQRHYREREPVITEWRMSKPEAR